MTETIYSFVLMFDVITFGAATRDVFLRSKAMELHREHGVMEACFVFGAKVAVEDIIFETGGGGTNNAVTFSRLGKLKTAVVTRIGGDASGEEIMRVLKREHIATPFVQRDRNGKTGYSTIILSREAERTILTYRGVSSQIDSAKIPWSKIKARLFHVSSLGGNLMLMEKIVDHAKKVNAKVFWNPGNGELAHGKAALAPILRKVDFVSLNREEAAVLTEKKLSDLGGIIKSMKKLSAHSIVTDGEKGAYSVSSEGVLHAPVMTISRLNLTGAGDAFTSAFALGYLMYGDPKTALSLGTLNATNVVHHMGAKSGILRHMPSKKEILEVKVKKASLK